MLKLLYPSLYVDTLMDIPLEKLRQKKIKTFLLDLDNTITEWNSNELRLEVLQWFENVKLQGFGCCIISNNGEQRIKLVADRLNVPFIHRAAKPRRGSFNRALEIMGVTVDEAAVVGDQVFTDILGGNRAGLFTILVKPLARREFVGTKINRTLEIIILSRLFKKFRPKGEDV